MPELMEPYAVGSQIREYEILELTSQSGLETVYRTRHVFLDEERSFKIIRTKLAHDTGYRDRFIREARLFSKLRHKHLTRLFEFGTLEEDTFFIVFEFVKGESIANRIRKAGRIPYWDALRIIRESAEALQIAHKQNLIHNNLSADCLILVATPEGNEITKVIDFSLARPNLEEKSSHGTDEDSFHTNWEYSSPESFTGNGQLDQQSDIYSLGIILYQMIAGSPPFQGASPGELMEKHLHAKPEELSDIPPILNQVLSKALSKSKEDRYVTVQDFVRDLNRIPPPENSESWSGETMNLVVPEEFPPGFQLAQRYVIDKMIGKGGMGTVYKARDKVLNVPVALKSINKNITNNQRMVERLKREVILARKVAHPNVCRIYDIGEANGQHYVTMEYLEGKTLAEMLSEQGSLFLETGIPLLKQLFLGLQEAHRVGIVHRDLKPENIMVDIHGRAFIMDFGISISEEVRRLTETGIVIGTPWFMAPEQFSTPNVGPTSDIYSMGIIMFEMFTGRLPYDAQTPASVMTAHVEGNMLRPSAIADIHPHLEKVILKAMARESSDRYQDVTELLTDLEATEETPYAATVVVPKPSFLQPPSVHASNTHSPVPNEESLKPWQRIVRYFKK